MKNMRTAIYFLMVCSLAMIMVFLGCGKKGLPLPPQIKGQKIAAPFDLKCILDDKKILVSWNHEIDSSKAFVKPQGFEVFMARKTIKACVGCPFEFKMTGYVPMPSMEFITDREKGYKYYFRVQATGNDNLRSEYSKTLQVEAE